MVRDLDYPQWRLRNGIGQRSLGLAADVTGQEDRHLAPAELEHERIFVPHLLALPVLAAGVLRHDLHAVDLDVVAGVDVRPPRACRLRPGSNLCERVGARHRNPLPHLARPELADDRESAAHVVGVAVRQREPIEPPETGGPDDRRHDAVADVERRSKREPAGIDEERRAMRKHDERGVALTDVDEGDVQPPVAPRVRKRPGIERDPRGRDRRRGRRGDAYAAACR